LIVGVRVKPAKMYHRRRQKQKIDH